MGMLLEGDERPDDADEAGVGVGVADQLPPHHDQDEPRHDARRWHRRHPREPRLGWSLDLVVDGVVPAVVPFVSEAEVVPLQAVRRVLLPPLH
ncbi:hypothetical protein BHM03_00060731 [Ensete ventricosum]|nr:hypothetical protein BHM03_00060731 [Ensete ventricosum]